MDPKGPETAGHAPDRAAIALSRGLLEGAPQADPAQPHRRWAYGWFGLFVATVFIAYHMTVLMVWNTPSSGLAKRFHSSVIKTVHGRRYFTATSNTQSWSMFAPNPNRTNVFIRVLVEDTEGEIWDMGHDIWKVDRYPYWFYDRMGKVNRRIDGKKGYQKSYGAWMCRQWATEHDGEMPVAVKFVKRWTKIPHPKEVIKRSLKTGNWGYDPWKLKDRQKEQERIVCKKTVNAQLNNEQRERLGIAMVDNDGFKPVRIRTWWDRQQAEAKREKVRKKAADRAEKLGAKAKTKSSNPRLPRGEFEARVRPDPESAPVKTKPAKPAG